MSNADHQVRSFKAVVFGATGAVGREIVKQLIDSPQWSHVTTIGRRPLQVEGAAADSSKLKQIVLSNMDSLLEQPLENIEITNSLSSSDSVFCALGTTRSLAGSAQAFKRVDFDYVAAAARLAKINNVSHFGLVSAQGASPKLWSSDVLLFHPFLYAKTKGLAENTVKEKGFDHVTIMRPGLMDRGDAARGAEKYYAKFVSSVPVSVVAAAMICDAEDFLSSKGTRAAGSVKVMEMKEIQSFQRQRVVSVTSPLPKR